MIRPTFFLLVTEQMIFSIDKGATEGWPLSTGLLLTYLLGTYSYRYTLSIQANQTRHGRSAIEIVPVAPDVQRAPVWAAKTSSLDLAHLPRFHSSYPIWRAVRPRQCNQGGPFRVASIPSNKQDQIDRGRALPYSLCMDSLNIYEMGISNKRKNERERDRLSLR